MNFRMFSLVGMKQAMSRTAFARLLLGSAVLLFMIAFFPVSASCSYTFDRLMHNDDGGRIAKDIQVLIDSKRASSIQVEPDVADFRNTVKSTIDNFDFMSVYAHPVMRDKGNGFRGVMVQGCEDNDIFYVKYLNPKDDPCGLTSLWDYISDYNLKKNDRNLIGGRSFIVKVKFKAATKSVSHDGIMALSEGMLRVIDPDNLKTLNAPDSGAFPGITGDGRPVINDFVKTFPELTGYLNTYGAVRSLLTVKQHNHIPYTHLTLRFGFNEKNAKKDFPYLSRYFGNIRSFFRLTETVKSVKGLTLATVVINSREDAFEMSLYTKKGRIIPMDSQGNPCFGNEEIVLSKLKNFSCTTISDMFIDVWGLKFETLGLIRHWALKTEPGRAVWSMKMGNAVKTRMYGRFANIIPSWLVDFIIPVNMTELIHEFTLLMFKANNGEGTSLVLDWDLRDRKNVVAALGFSSEFMNSFFLRFGLKIMNRNVALKKKQSEEIDRIKADIARRVRSDLHFQS